MPKTMYYEKDFDILQVDKLLTDDDDYQKNLNYWLDQCNKFDSGPRNIKMIENLKTCKIE